MATTTTFDTLQQDLRAYLERGSASADAIVTAQLPRLINLGERRCAQELKVLGFIEVLTSVMNPGNAVYPKPDRWRRTVSINFGTGVGYNTRTPLFSRAYEYVRAFWPDETQVAQPKFYADYDYNNWLFGATPDMPYPFEVLADMQPPLLDEENQTNWLTDIVPNLLLYASLLECTPFLKNDERIPVWQQLYDRAAGMVSGEDVARILGRGAVRKED